MVIAIFSFRNCQRRDYIQSPSICQLFFQKNTVQLQELNCYYFHYITTEVKFFSTPVTSANVLLTQSNLIYEEHFQIYPDQLVFPHMQHILIQMPL